MISAVIDQRSQAMARAVEGDAQAFAALIEPLLNPACRLAAVMLNDRNSAEDAVQEASIKAWRKLGQLRGDLGSLRPWFLSIVANECRMVRRQRWWTVVKLPEIGPLHPTGVQFDDTSSDLKSALLRLSPEERLPLVLHFYLDLPLDEVARTLGLSPAAAKSRIYRTARKLRADLTLEEVF
jgi:RNA polymerase sigma-70 factor, ECF subfamily